MDIIEQIIIYIEKINTFKESSNQNNITSEENYQIILGYQKDSDSLDDVLKDIKKIKEDYDNCEISKNYKEIIDSSLPHIEEHDYYNLDILINNIDQINSTQIKSWLFNINDKIKTIKNGVNIIKSLNLLKKTSKNLVLIGANGSGKSTFSRHIKDHLTKLQNNFAVVIPAQRTFFINENNSISTFQNAFYNTP
ncbi:hypothetical protein fh0823_24160 [Francisella halioticida]|uniref:hypothetical protein n=1 Tax=Francisella halioticida TaxID=549298 RepID=UPI001AF0EAA0|nr:hypothetical protein [Francisella halioticida]BCD92277.1 hypothetical protein fh0823_24160 [Francisella halioticida]